MSADTAPLFAKGSRLRLRAGFLLVLAVVLMSLDSRGYLSFLRSLLVTLVYPLHVVATLPVDTGQWLSDQLTTRAQLLEDKSRLEERLLLLQPGLRRMAALEEENRHLRELLATQQHAQDRMLMAELMAVKMQSQAHQITINKGENVGAYIGQPIIDATGIMGQIYNVGAFSSHVRLITDSLHAIPVQVNRNGLRTIAMGTGERGSLLLDTLPIHADVRVGDLLVSSGLGQRFPRGYPVGIVSALKRSKGAPFLHARVRPSAELERSHAVLMVWPTSPPSP